MAKLEQLVTPLELLAAIRGGALKSDILKQYRTNDQELAVMLQPLYRGGKMTKDEFNNFFRGLSLNPPEPRAAETVAVEQKPEQPPESEPVPVSAPEAPTQMAGVSKTPKPIEQGPIPGLEHAHAELERAADQAAVEEAVPQAAAPKVPVKPAPAPKPRPTAEPKAKPPAPPEPKAKPEPKPKPEPKDKPELKQQKEAPAAAVPTAPKTAKPPLKAVPAPAPAGARIQEPKIQPDMKSLAAKSKEEATIDLITVTVEEPLVPLVDEPAVPTGQPEKILSTILSRLDSIDARLLRIEKKLETR